MAARLFPVVACSVLLSTACSSASDDQNELLGQAPPIVLLPAARAADSMTSCLALASANRAIEGGVNSAIPESARPPKGVAFLDPNYGSCVMRVTDHVSEPPVGFARSDYSRRQAFNADNSRFIVSAVDGFWHLYSSADYQWIKVLSGIAGDSEPHWHPTDPDLLWYLPDQGLGMSVMIVNVADDSIRVAASLGGLLQQRWPDAMAASTRSEGSPSADGRYWAFLVENAQFDLLGIAVWDMQLQRLIAVRDVEEEADYITMSPSGRHVVVGWESGVAFYDPQLQERSDTGLSTEHSDIAIDRQGNDVYVSIDYAGDDGPLVMFNLDTHLRTDLLPTYLARTATALHVSGKAYDTPGWAVFSTYDSAGVRQQWLHEKIFAVELQRNPRVIQLAHHHTVRNPLTGFAYFREPHAAVSRDLSRVLVNSNWHSDDVMDVDAYVVRIPKHWEFH